MKINQIISILVLLIIVGAGAFWGGTKYQQKKITSQFSQRAGLNDTFGQGMGRGINNDIAKNRGQTPGFRQTIGEIISVDDKSMTVKLVDGSSKIVLFSDSTVVNQSVEASKNDLKIGIKVAVMGDQNTDGSVTSKNIEINPHVATISPTVTPTK